MIFPPFLNFLPMKKGKEKPSAVRPVLIRLLSTQIVSCTYQNTATTRIDKNCHHFVDPQSRPVLRALWDAMI